MGNIYNENGANVGSVTKSNDGYTISNEYGSKTASANKAILSEDDYVIRDNLGNRTGTVEKDLFSDDYTVKDSGGNKVGKLEKSIFGKGKYIAKDQDGKKKGEVNIPIVPVAETLSTGGFLAIIILGIFVFISFDSIPENLERVAEIGSDVFVLVTIPAVVFALIVIGKMILDKKSNVKIGFFKNAMELGLLGLLTYIIVDAVLIIIMAIGSSQAGFLEAVVMLILAPIMYFATYAIFFIAITVIGSLIATLINQ